jgi:hypothetical protein
MATWTVEIEVADLDAKLVNVTATRTDGVDIRTYALKGVSADTHDKTLSEIRAIVSAELWAAYQAELAKEAKVATLLAGWETALASDLNALEV